MPASSLHEQEPNEKKGAFYLQDDEHVFNVRLEVASSKWLVLFK